MSRLTYAIGWRHHRDRERNLSRVLGWLASFPDMEVVVVEQDNMRRFSPPPGVRHIFARSSGPYNRSWGFNIALKESDSPHIVFGDSDIVMQAGEFSQAVAAAQSLDVVSPYSSVVDLTPAESLADLDGISSIRRPGRGEADGQKTNLCGGVVIFSREACERVGGWDEDFAGWGGEDDMMTFKVMSAGLKSASMPYRCYHLWHPRPAPDPVLYSKTLGMLKSKVALGGESAIGLALGAFPSCGDRRRFE